MKLIFAVFVLCCRIFILFSRKSDGECASDASGIYTTIKCFRRKNWLQWLT